MEILIIACLIGLAYIAFNGKTKEQRSSASMKLGEWIVRLFFR